MRYGDGDGQTGRGMEVGLGIRYTNPSRFTMSGWVRSLIAHSAGHRNWGIHGRFALDPEADGQGLSASMTSGYGDVSSGVQKVWQQGLSNEGAAGTSDDDRDEVAIQMEGHLGYGLMVSNQARGRLYPYVGMIARGASQRYRLGVDLRRDSRFHLDLVGETDTGMGEHSIMLKTALPLD